jgi:hypothetical protein
MAGKDRGTELPRRIRGAAWTEPLLSAAPGVPVLSPELRQCMQAAVTAERADAVTREQQRGAGNRTAEPPRRVPPSMSSVSEEAGLETGFPDNGTSGERTGVGAAEPAARPERITGPVPEEVTGLTGPPIEPRPTATLEPVVMARTAAGPEPAVQPQPGKPRRRGGGRLVVLGLALIVTGSLATVLVQHFSRPPTAQAPAGAAVRARAAAWVAEQISPDATVSCDAVMCAALKADGFPAGQLVMLGPASSDPVPSDLVVQTATVRALFGSSLAETWAPAVLASFGSGPGAITVRVVAPHGAAAYRASLRADLAGRKRSGAALLHDSRITVSATAKGQLVAGQVDLRLLAALAALAGHLPVDIVQFGSLGPGASPGVPLRFADLAENVPAAHIDAAAYMRAAWAVLSRAPARIRPGRALSGTLQHQAASGTLERQAVLRVEFTAPSPLGRLGPGPS